jgi:hypothetical protein
MKDRPDVFASRKHFQSDTQRRLYGTQGPASGFETTLSRFPDSKNALLLYEDVGTAGVKMMPAQRHEAV